MIYLPSVTPEVWHLIKNFNPTGTRTCVPISHFWLKRLRHYNINWPTRKEKSMRMIDFLRISLILVGKTTEELCSGLCVLVVVLDGTLWNILQVFRTSSAKLKRSIPRMPHSCPQRLSFLLVTWSYCWVVLRINGGCTSPPASQNFILGVILVHSKYHFAVSDRLQFRS